MRDEELDEQEQSEAEAGEEVRRSGAVGFVGGLVLGALIGASIALLVAQARGAVTRRRIKRLVRDMGDKARDTFEDALEGLAEEKHRLERRLR